MGAATHQPVPLERVREDATVWIAQPHVVLLAGPSDQTVGCRNRGHCCRGDARWQRETADGPLTAQSRGNNEGNAPTVHTHTHTTLDNLPTHRKVGTSYSLQVQRAPLSPVCVPHFDRLVVRAGHKHPRVNRVPADARHKEGVAICLAASAVASGSTAADQYKRLQLCPLHLCRSPCSRCLGASTSACFCL